MDVVHPLMVVACANRSLQIFDLNNPGVIFKVRPPLADPRAQCRSREGIDRFLRSYLQSQDSPLKQQTRTVSCFPTAKGFAVGSIEGRVAIQHMDKDASS